MVLPVKVDRDDPQRVAIDWEAHLEKQTSAEEQRRDALADLGPVPAGGIGEMITESAAVIDARNDPELKGKILEALEAAGVDADRSSLGGDATIDALERLAELRDRGILSENEFRAQKKRILGES